MGMENQFQLNEGLKFSNPLEYRAFEPRFIDAGLSRGAPSSRGHVHDPTNIIFPGKLSWPLKEEQIRLDGTLDITDRRSKGHCSLMFFFRGLYQDYLQGRFFFQFGTNINLDLDVNRCGSSITPPDTEYLKKKPDRIYLIFSKMNGFTGWNR